MIGYIAPYTFTQFGTTGNTALSLFYTLSRSPFPHALVFSVLTSRILATDLSQSHCTFKSHMKSSCHSLINFLPLFCSCQFNSMPSSYPGRLASRNSTLHFRLLFYTWSRLLNVSLHNPSARTTQKTQPILLRRRVYWSVA
jgi:hypothetical protein